MHTRLAMKRDIVRPKDIRVSACRICRCATLALVALAISACFDFDWDLSGVGSPGSGCCGPVAPVISPVYVRMLRGDTVRIAACQSYAFCGVGNDTGNVPSQWTLTDDTVIVALAGDTPTKVVESATSALVRAVAPGRATMSVVILADRSRRLSHVTVADSAAIATIELISYVAQPNELRVGGIMSFTARLKDGAGFVYRGRPTAVSVSDTTILGLSVTTDVDHSARAEVRGLKAGQAELLVKFLDVSRVVRLTVLP